MQETAPTDLQELVDLRLHSCRAVTQQSQQESLSRLAVSTTSTPHGQPVVPNSQYQMRTRALNTP